MGVVIVPGKNLVIRNCVLCSRRTRVPAPVADRAICPLCRRLAGHRAWIGPEQACRQCGGTFLPRTAHTLFCSVACSKLDSAQRKVARDPRRRPLAPSKLGAQGTKCRRCGDRLGFVTDTQGRAYEICEGCGVRRAILPEDRRPTWLRETARARLTRELVAEVRSEWRPIVRR